eukprot:351382-Chlamydomonas_euryale.AAC.3
MAVSTHEISLVQQQRHWRRPQMSTPYSSCICTKRVHHLSVIGGPPAALSGRPTYGVVAGDADANGMQSP